MTDLAPFKCPRCGIDLFVGRAPDMTMHGCGRCGGLWLDNENTGIALRGLSPATKEMVVRVTTSATAEVDKTPAIACPQCQKPLERVKRAEIEVDICGEHGTWFDRTELYRLVDAVAPPPPRPMPPPAQPMYYAPAVYDGGGTSGLAIAGFICSFFCGLLGLILSIVAYNQINRSGGRIGGKGLAVAGIVISIVSMVLGIMMNASKFH